ncbi:tannase/feruloyl esterase family alpha/beta hydrolase [Sphingomonas sp.]|uniref:tannase/feruloyl esterase family alpha/beta hydrolase n=1 Tax=Sphingomonas sp. TaxID=28214 RepID=UPI001B122295|nr:tannase/feruloyl esterase family alpha/beta hydrolase [Sphingomonas sp.]MBO9713869.1 tannase/feruloyl esterase family alpha/beta hydrolase [Sphingomonas sp.]
MKSKVMMAALLGGTALLGWVAPADAANDPAARCENLAKLALPDVTIKSAAYVAAGPYIGPNADAGGVKVTLPAHCRIVGVIKPAPRSNIGFEVWMPASGWNGKFQGAGNGGYAGDIAYRGGLVEGVERGYAVATTDTGHVANGLTATWAIGNLDAQIDYGHRAVHLTAVNAKAIVQAYYGRKPRLSIFSSCSNGGRQALMEAQRYPGDYDGIIAGAPAYDWTRLAQIFLWNGQSLTRTPGSNIPPAKLPAIQAAILAQCDGLDGQKDGLIRDPRRCDFKAASMVCTGAETNQCLTPDQAEALDRIHQGPPNSRARRIGYSLGGVEAEPGGWNPWISNANPLLTAAGVFGLGLPHYFANMTKLSFASFDPMRDGPALDGALAPFLNATDTDLSGFFGRGGKLILYHGWGDAAVPPEMTIDYYDTVMARMRGRAAGAMRLFLVPGMEHCNAGPGLNSFGQGAAPEPGADPAGNIDAAMEAWIERGRVPEQLVGVSARNWQVAPGDMRLAEPRRTGLICAYPKVSIWDGRNDPGKASSYRCGKE